jgi:hypothetical protein
MEVAVTVWLLPTRFVSEFGEASIVVWLASAGLRGPRLIIRPSTSATTKAGDAKSRALAVSMGLYLPFVRGARPPNPRLRKRLPRMESRS